MPIEHDCRGLSITAANADAVAAFDAAITAFCGMRVDIGDRLKEAFAADPDMPMARLAKVAFLKMFATAKMDKAAADALEEARAILGQGEALPREHRHLDALAHWVAGDTAAAAAGWEAILIDDPRDLFAIKLAQLNRFYLGEPEAMRDGIARALPAWSGEVPGYGYLNGSYAFALEECGNYDEAERRGRAAVDRDPTDVWSAHAVAHVMEMQGRSKQGLGWLNGLRDRWGQVHNFKHHAHWHRALFALELGRHDEALAIYDADIWTDVAGDYLDISNAASILWRLEEEGVDVGERWEPAIALSAERVEDHAIAFGTCHYALALATGRRKEDLARLKAAQEAHARTADDTAAQVWDACGRALVDGIEALRDGRPGEAVERLYPVRRAVYRLGGSRAQRDLFERMLIAAALVDGRAALARALLAERGALRPADRWNAARTAEAQRALGETEAAAAAERDAAALTG